jgi:hypothetical protein
MTRLVLFTTLWASYSTELNENKYRGHTYQDTPWLDHFLQQEGYGLVPYMNIMPVQLCKFISIVRSGRVFSLETSWASKSAGESHWTS